VLFGRPLSLGGVWESSFKQRRSCLEFLLLVQNPGGAACKTARFKKEGPGKPTAEQTKEGRRVMTQEKTLSTEYGGRREGKRGEGGAHRFFSHLSAGRKEGESAIIKSLPNKGVSNRPGQSDRKRGVPFPRD